MYILCMGLSIVRHMAANIGICEKKSIIEQWASNISRETTAKLAQCDLTKHNTPPIIDI